MKSFDKDAWSEAIEDVIRLFGFNGKVTIEKGNEPDEYFINHSAFGCPFTGIFPKTDSYFTVLTSSHEFVDHNQLTRKHREGIVFDTTTMVPLFYSIYNEPEYMRLMINDFARYERGNLIYANNGISGGYKQYFLKEPIFESEVFDIHEVFKNVTSKT